MSNQRHDDGGGRGGTLASLASIMWAREDDRARYSPRREAQRDREAQRRADDSEASLRRRVARLKRGGAR